MRILGFRRAGRAETDLAGARRLAEEEREGRLKDVYPECNRICAGIREAFSEIRKCCDLFEQSKAEMDPELRSSVKGITRKMKENFIARMRRAVVPEAVPEMGYDRLAGFSKNLQETMAKIEKINSDNRYIFSLYKEDAARFKEPFERALGLSNALKEKLEGKREEAERFGQVISLIEELGREKEHVAKLEPETAQTEGRLAEKKAELAGFGENIELKAKLEEFSRVSGEFSSAGGKISAPVSVLERALRKYGRICDPSKKPERYAEAPVSELLGEGGDYPKFKEILVEMRTLIEKGELELKNPEKVKERIDWLLSGNLGPLLGEYVRLGEEKAKLEKELEPLQKRERDRQGLEAAVARLTAKLQEQRKTVEEMRADFERRKGELGKRFEEVVGKELVLRESGGDWTRGQPGAEL